MKVDGWIIGLLGEGAAADQQVSPTNSAHAQAERRFNHR